MTILLQSILLLPLLLFGAEAALSRRGDLANPDMQNIRLVESERIDGTSSLFASQSSIRTHLHRAYLISVLAPLRIPTAQLHLAFKQLFAKHAWMASSHGGTLRPGFRTGKRR